jgi:hypothetical protein
VCLLRGANWMLYVIQLIFRPPRIEVPVAVLPVYVFYPYSLLNLFSFVALTSSFDALFHVHLQGFPCSWPHVSADLNTCSAPEGVTWLLVCEQGVDGVEQEGRGELGTAC